MLFFCVSSLFYNCKIEQIPVQPGVANAYKIKKMEYIPANAVPDKLVSDASRLLRANDKNSFPIRSKKDFLNRYFKKMATEITTEGGITTYTLVLSKPFAGATKGSPCRKEPAYSVIAANQDSRRNWGPSYVANFYPYNRGHRQHRQHRQQSANPRADLFYYYINNLSGPGVNYGGRTNTRSSSRGSGCSSSGGGTYENSGYNRGSRRGFWSWFKGIFKVAPNPCRDAHGAYTEHDPSKELPHSAILSIPLEREYLGQKEELQQKEESNTGGNNSPGPGASLLKCGCQSDDPLTIAQALTLDGGVATELFDGTDNASKLRRKICACAKANQYSMDIMFSLKKDLERIVSGEDVAKSSCLYTPPQNKTPCESIKNQLGNPKFKTKLDFLKGRTGLREETGFSQSKDGTFTRLKVEKGGNSLNMPIDTRNTMGYMHVHQDDYHTGIIINGYEKIEKHIKMFSPNDIIKFLQIAKYTHWNKIPTSKVYGMMVSSAGNYTIKFTGKPENISNDLPTIEDLDKIYKKYFKKYNDKEEAFLKFLKKIGINGIGLYKVENSGQIHPKTLNNGGNVETSNCN